jgi:hypothetical protein
MTVPGLATRDHPANPSEIERAEWSEERLGAHKAGGRGYLSQEIETACPPSVLHRNADPHMIGPWQVGGQLDESFGSLG